MNKHLICLALGKTGVGKSSFINAITGKQDCTVSSEGKACTTIYNIIETERIGQKLVFIDTPGLMDAKGDGNNIKTITDAIAAYPGFRCLLILMKFQDKRLDISIVKTLEKYMDIFPLQNFWDHVIIIRTHAKKDDDDFEDDVKEVKGSIVKCLNEPDFKEFKKFMENKKIALPYSIQEFYVDCNNKKFERTLSKNKTEFDDLCRAIKNCSPLFKEIKKNDYEEVEKSGSFEIKRYKRKLTFIPYEGNQFTGEPILLKEEELSKFPIVERKTRHEYGSVRSNCTKKEIFRKTYETCIYNVEGKIVTGKECFKEGGWVPKN